MKWITRARVKVDRVACPWLIKRFVDKDAEFTFVPAEQVQAEATFLSAIPFDVPGVELGHHNKECSFEAIVKNITSQRPGLVLREDRERRGHRQHPLQPAEGPGLSAIAEGFRHLGLADDHAINKAEWIVYDALYAYCTEMVKQGKPHGAFTA
jgi:hypothetical protein